MKKDDFGTITDFGDRYTTCDRCVYKDLGMGGFNTVCRHCMKTHTETEGYSALPEKEDVFSTLGNMLDPTTKFVNNIGSCFPTEAKYGEERTVVNSGKEFIEYFANTGEKRWLAPNESATYKLKWVLCE
jgi:hypothetical protein